MADVEFRNVWKIYDKKVEAVRDLSFLCKEGEFFAILGPSGCGKTSSLRMLAGLENVSRGEALIKGVVVNDMSPRERNVAMSFENYGLYPDFNIFENIAYPLRVHKTPEDEVKKSVYSIARTLRLTDVLSYKPAALSGGQKQRVSIARALVRNPDVTIMDEPLSHLDAKARVHMRSVVKRLHNKLGLTTIYVTHDQIEAMTMADKILIMNNGKAQQIGTPDEVYLNPANLFVAGFIGTPPMNLLEGSVGQDGVVVSCGDVVSVKMTEYAGKIHPGQKVILGVRPHDIAISRQAFDDGSKGSVYVAEGLGETTVVSVNCGNIIVKAETDGLLTEWNYDDPIYFRVDPEKARLFDAQSEERIAPAESEESV